MNLKIKKEEISSTEVIFSDTNEQSIELDYILPDYYPEIFRILKCITTPQIVSYCIENTKLTYEMSVCIRILYCAENSNAVHTINQKLIYSRKIDIDRTCSAPEVSLIPQISFINCRAVNPRRIDLRGAVSTVISITDTCCKEVISDIDGGNIQMKKNSFTYPANHLKATKQIVVSEKYDVGTSKPPIIDIIRNDATISSIDKKIIADKLILKGEICINMLYTCLKDNIDNIEGMQFTLPFSQIIDLKGIDDRFNCDIKTDIVSCEIIPCSDGDGNSKLAECIINMLINCSAYKTSTAEFVVDEYSTSYTTNSEKADITLEASPYHIDTVCVLKNTINAPENELECIYDAWCTLKNISVISDINENSLCINGTIIYMVLAKNTDGSPVLLEKEDSFTESVPAENLSELSKAAVNIIPMSCSYTLSSDNIIELKAELRITGHIKNFVIINSITDITVNEDEPIDKNNKYALKIYYTDENEDLWEIAKKYGTSISAIIEENEIEDDTVSEKGMLLIPIV